jgi:hypothetical protein
MLRASNILQELIANPWPEEVESNMKVTTENAKNKIKECLWECT